MKILLAINHNGQYSIFKKLYDPRLEENYGLDQYLEEVVGEFEAGDNRQYGKVYLADVYSVREYCSNPENQGTAEEIELNIKLIKEVFDSNDIV